MSGWIISDDGRSRPCSVSNLSLHGAKLSLLSRDDLPAEFTILVDCAKHRGRLVWRTGFHAGVEFIITDTSAAHAV
jgi:hypothetical protein